MREGPQPEAPPTHSLTRGDGAVTISRLPCYTSWTGLFMVGACFVVSSFTGWFSYSSSVSSATLMSVVFGIVALLFAVLGARLVFLRESWSAFRDGRRLQRTVCLFETNILQGSEVFLSDGATVRVAHGAYGLATVRIVDEDHAIQIYGMIDKGYFETVAREFSATLQIPIES